MRLYLTHKKEEAHDDAVWAATWGPINNSIITGSVDESVKNWALGEGEAPLEVLHTWTGHTLGVLSVDVDPSGVYAASSSLDSFIRVWNIEEHTTKAVVETAPSETWQVRLHPSADQLLVAAAGGSSNRITIYGTDEAAALQHYLLPPVDEKKKKDTFVLSIAYSPDGQRIACGCMDGMVAVFDVVTGKIVSILEGHFKPVRCLTFTPDSRNLLTACDDMHAHSYDLQDGSISAAFSGHESWVLSIACHPDGSAFATGSSDSKVKLWDLRGQSCVQTVTEHSDQVWGVSFNADGTHLASVSDDKSVAVYSYS